MNETIVIINDDAAEGELLVEVLKSRFYFAYFLTPDNIERLSRASIMPGLAIVDVRCIEVYPRLKTLLESSTPVIFSGTVDVTLDREKIFTLGGVDYLAKPFQPAEVLARVETQMKLRRLQEETFALQVMLSKAVADRKEARDALQNLNAVLEQRIIESTATLHASEAMFRYLLTRANDGYVIVNEQEQVLYANTKAQTYLGLVREIDKNAPPTFMELVAQQYRREPQAAWAMWPKKMFINKMPVPLYLVSPETAHARAFWLQVEMLDIAAGLDTQAGRIICLRDITEKTTLQEELSRFHSVIAHKLRTPLVPLYTGLNFLVEQIPRLSRDDILMFVQSAAEGAEHLYKEIEEIVRYLDTPRIATPETAFPLANFAALVANISQDLQLTDITVTVAESLQERRLMLSQWSLEMILWEILENAKKFHPRNAPVVTIDVVPEGVEQASIRIGDNGLTLPLEQLVRMWMPYYQVDKFTTGQIAGMGLGLSMVAQHVWSVGGTCRSFNREDGPGIVIELVLPCYNG